MAGKIGQVTGQEVKTYKGVDNIRVLQVALFGANPESVVYMNTSGEDTAPLNGDMVIVRELGADKYTFGVRDPVLLVSEPGEKRIYSRDSGGNVVASFFLKTDGTLQIDTDLDLIANVAGDLTATVGGKTELDSTGDVDITTPNVNIDGNLNVTGVIDCLSSILAGGDVSAEGDVIADSLAAVITLLTHLHTDSIGGPCTPPTNSPGTAPIPFDTHKHAQGADSAGDSQVTTNGPQ